MFYLFTDVPIWLNSSPCRRRSSGLQCITLKTGSARARPPGTPEHLSTNSCYRASCLCCRIICRLSGGRPAPTPPLVSLSGPAAANTSLWDGVDIWSISLYFPPTHACTTLTQKHRTSWRRNLDSLVTSVVADGIRWVSRALGKRLRFQVYLLFWDQGRISLCRPERLFPNKRPALSTLRDGCISIMRPMSGVGCRQLLLFSPMLQCVLAGLCEVLNAVEENVQLAVTGVPSPFSSVHHGSHSLPASSSSPLLLLPLFFLRSLSSNSLAIQKPRCDLNAVSSTMKRISSEHGVCHLRC